MNFRLKMLEVCSQTRRRAKVQESSFCLKAKNWEILQNALISSNHFLSRQSQALLWIHHPAPSPKSPNLLELNHFCFNARQNSFHQTVAEKESNQNSHLFLVQEIKWILCWVYLWFMVLLESHFLKNGRFWNDIFNFEKHILTCYFLKYRNNVSAESFLISILAGCWNTAIGWERFGSSCWLQINLNKTFLLCAQRK